jgi:peptidoglycan/LPS O-acetylase OafA/YrhL
MPITTAPNERLHALDALRAGCLLLGIVLHGSMSFIPGAPYWVVRDMDATDPMAAVFFTIHTFRMTTFFVIAGFFARMMFHRLGAGGFVRDRARRILIPLVVGWLTVMPVFFAVSYWAMGHSYGPEIYRTPFGEAPSFSPRMIPLQHFWFLYLLTWFYALTVAVSWAMNRLDPGFAVGKLAHRAARRLMNSPFSVVVLALPAALALYSIPDWTMWGGVPAPDRGLAPNPQGFLCYAVAFGFGWIVHRQSDMLGVFKRWWLPNIIAGMVLTWFCLSISGHEPDQARAATGVTKFADALCYALAGWTWTFGLIGAALRFLSGYSAIRRYLADASYWMYLVHMPVVVALQGAVSRMEWHWALKFGFIMTVTVAVLLASYQLLVRNTVIGAVLNGKKRGKVLPVDPEPVVPLAPAPHTNA